jgi:hypothetical protein
MGSHPTLDQPTGGPEATPPTANPDAFIHLNPALAPVGNQAHPLAHPRQLRAVEDVAVRGARVVLEEALENPPTTTDFRHQQLGARASRAQLDGAERAFDTLNPEFGVPADTTSPLGHRDLHQRERALALGVRVTVHDSRQNDRDPVIWQPGQDYRAADALQAARAQPTRARWGPERLGPER